MRSNDEPRIIDEALVPDYVLPDALVSSDGTPVRDVAGWEERRNEILDLFASEIYGRTPQSTVSMSSDVTVVDTTACDGAATRSEVVLTLGTDHPVTVTVLIYVPNHRSAPAPAFVGLNFLGNHSVDPDPSITLSDRWMRDSPETGVVNNRATDAARGSMARRWPIRRIIERGYAVATAYYGDLYPDFDGGARDSVLRLFAPDPDRRADDGWGAIGAWAWGLSRILDCLGDEPAIDASRVAVLGHSRLGKTALWAAAQDERFCMAISNDSGCGGAALFRRKFGERIDILARLRSYWFSPRFASYTGREEDLPVDQHQLIAALAPRPVYIASAAEDLNADPRGELLAGVHADSVYRLYGSRGIEVTSPVVDQPVLGRVSYHVRSGGHDLTAYDWEQFLDAADLHADFAHGEPSEQGVRVTR